jgi:hypothetical protein
MHDHPSTSLWQAAALALVAVAACAAPAARADAPARVPLLPKYAQECSACHIAYPPGLLPAASWQRLMANLPRHFGTDASLDEASVREIATWLNTQSGSYRKAQREAAPPPDDRITRSQWFVREHREIAPETWKRPAVKSAANCAACHTRADQGDFNEHTVRIPR